MQLPLSTPIPSLYLGANASSGVGASLGTAEDRPPERHWFAVSTRPRHEKTVVKHLTQRSVENYLPLYHALRKWQDRKVWIDMPLFSGYVFVRIAAAERCKIVQVPGVVRMVSFNGVLQPVTDDEIQRLHQVLENWRAEPFPYMTEGKLVRVVDGPLAGLEGTVVHRKGKARIVISVQSIMRSFIAEVDADALQLSHSHQARRRADL
jgi:transcription antitermination factor NusG